MSTYVFQVLLCCKTIFVEKEALRCYGIRNNILMGVTHALESLPRRNWLTCFHWFFWGIVLFESVI